MVREETLDILSLVMAVYRSPLHYRELFQAQTELPEDVESVLRIASGDTEMIRHHAKALGVAPDRLREAAVFFIEQVFFVRGGNYYRVLGLDTNATETQIKEHHRFLIRLFHPDRHSGQESWTDNYARRVNRAYNVLRKSEQRQAYDLSLSHMQTENWEDAQTTASLNRSTSATGTSFSFDRQFARQKSHPFDSLRRYLPGIVMGGLAMAAFIFVATVYVANRQFSAPSKPLKQDKSVKHLPSPSVKKETSIMESITDERMEEVRGKRVDSPSQEVEGVIKPGSGSRSTPRVPVSRISEEITEDDDSTNESLPVRKTWNRDNR